MASHTFATDTSQEADEVQLELIRQMSPAERFLKANAMSQRCRQMAMDAIQRLHPNCSEDELRIKFIDLAYGPQLAEQVRQWQQAQRQ